MSLSSHSVSHTPTTSTSTSSSSAALSLALASASGPPGECAATSSSLATLLTSGGIDTRESLFGYLQGLTASPRVTDEEQRERERLYRRLVKRQRRACLPRSVKDNTNNVNELPSASRQRAAAAEGDVGLSGTHARERKRRRTKAADDGSKFRERSGSHSLGAAASEGIGGDRPQGAFARPVPSWIPSPVALASSSSSLQVLNSSSPYGSSSSTTSSPSPSPSLYDPYTTSSSTGSIGSLLSSAGAFEPVPIVPRPSGAASFLPPHRAQQRPPSPLAARHLVGGQLSSPPPWDRHDESYHHHSLQQQPPPPYLDRGQHTSRGLYAPGNLVTPLSASTPMRQEQRSLPAAPPSRHHQSTVGSYSSLELETERYPQQRHHTAAYPEWLGGASSSSAPAAVRAQQDARQRDPVACLEWDCPLEDPSSETFAECSSFGSSPAPPLFAHDHALPYHPYQPPHLQHAHQQQQPHLQQHQRQQQQHQQQHYHLRAALTEAHQLSAQIAYNQVGGRGTEDSEDGRLSPSELADLLLLYPDFRQPLQHATSDPTTTALPSAPTASAGSMTGAATAAAALPSLGVSVPSPLFAWLAGSL